MPGKLVAEGVDLELIEGWQKARRLVLASDIEVALRFGFPVRRGIVVDSLRVSAQRRPYELREAYENVRDVENHPQIREADEFIDNHISPGWKRAGEDLDRSVDEGNTFGAENAEIPSTHATTFDEVVLMPTNRKSIKVIERFSRESVRQSVIGLDSVLKARLVKVVGDALDPALLSGDGTSDTITGMGGRRLVG